MPSLPVIICVIPKNGIHKDQTVYVAGFAMDGSPLFTDTIDRAASYINVEVAENHVMYLVRQGYMVGLEEL